MSTCKLWVLFATQKLQFLFLYSGTKSTRAIKSSALKNQTRSQKKKIRRKIFNDIIIKH